MNREEKKEAALKLQRDPALFITHILGGECEPYQEVACKAITEHDRVAIAACHNVGKSWLMARILLWFLITHPKSKVISTAPTFNQIQNILWSEIRSAYRDAKIPLGGSINLTEWRLDADWFAIGFSPKNEVVKGEGQGSQSSFQGFHAEDILVIFDEATGILPNVWTMAEGLLTSGRAKFIAIANPTSRNTEFFKCFKSPEWHKIYLSCFDSINMKVNNFNSVEDIENEVNELRLLNDIEVQKRIKSYKIEKPFMLTANWVIQKALNWGIDSPLFVSKVLGKFPDSADNTLINLGHIEDAQRRVYFPVASDRRMMGVDVARFGTDQTVLTYLHGYKFVHKKVLAKRDTTQVVGEIIQLCNAHGLPDVICVDETGLGAGVVDGLREKVNQAQDAWRRVDIRGVQFGAAPKCDLMNCKHTECEKAKYVNLKARMYDKLANDLKTNLQLPINEDVYLEELSSIKYTYDSKGRMIIESKDDFKKRTGLSSPDHADSLALANYARYDEIGVGSFKGNSSFGAPISSTLGRQNKW